MLWKDLRERYYQWGVFQIIDLQKMLFAIKQGDMTIYSYYSKLKPVWEELENFWPILGCPYSTPYTCELGVVREYKLNDYVIKFCRGLKEQYVVVISQVMLMRLLLLVLES